MPNVEEQKPEPNETAVTLPPGVYEVTSTDGGDALAPLAERAQPAVRLDSRAQRSLEYEVAAFFDAERTARLRAAGLPHRRGILLIGAPGCGKTSMLATLFAQLVEYGAPVLINPAPKSLASSILPRLRQADATRPVVAIFDNQWRAHELISDVVTGQFTKKIDPLPGLDRLLTIIVLDQPYVPFALRRLDLINRVIEVAPLSSAQRRELVVRHYPLLSSAELEFALTLTADGSVKLLHEACRLLLAGEDPDVVRDHIDELLAMPTGDVPLQLSFGTSEDPD